MIRDYWIYQERQNPGGQWAVYIVKEYEKGKPDSAMLDLTFYSEQIPTKTHTRSFVCWKFPTIADYTEAVIDVLEGFTIVDAQDRSQLNLAIARIFE